MRAVIVDDEDLGRGVVREMLRRHPDIEIVGDCANGFEAVKAINELKPDLLFLDIQMPKLDGFEVLELVQGAPAIIFVTAYDNYAVRAFDAHAVDYLLKPFNAERFDAAVAQARGRLQGARREPAGFLERVVVKDGARVHVIPVDKLDCVEAQDDYVALRSERRSYLKQQTITSLEAQLDPARFVRIHRSWIVNLERIARLEAHTKDTHLAILQDGAQLPVSRSGYLRLRELLG